MLMTKPTYRLRVRRQRVVLVRRFAVLISRRHRLQLMHRHNHLIHKVVTSLVPRRTHRIRPFREHGVIHVGVATLRIASGQHTAPYNLGGTSQRIQVHNAGLRNGLLHRVARVLQVVNNHLGPNTDLLVRITWQGVHAFQKVNTHGRICIIIKGLLQRVINHCRASTRVMKIT